MRPITPLLFAAFALAACDPNTFGNNGFLRTLPEEIVAIAGPNQDLKAVRLVEEDGCYWYRHIGPVETTMLPLRDTAGRPICTRPAV